MFSIQLTNNLQQEKHFHLKRCCMNKVQGHRNLFRILKLNKNRFINNGKLRWFICQNKHKILNSFMTSKNCLFVFHPVNGRHLVDSLYTVGCSEEFERTQFKCPQSIPLLRRQFIYVGHEIFQHKRSC